MKVALLAVTAEGRKLAGLLTEKLDNATLLLPEDGEKTAALLHRCWHDFEGFICIMATGIVVRSIAPLLSDKYTDPCVVVLDQQGKHVISLLSGHLGGGNQLATEVAELTGGTAVITTASDTSRLVPLDLWMQSQQLCVADRSQLTALSALMVNKGTLRIHTEFPVTSLPQGLQRSPQAATADCRISLFAAEGASGQPVLHPKIIVIGVGCNRNTPVEEFEIALQEILADHQIARQCIRNLASIDLKADEIGLLKFARQNHWEIDFFNREQLNEQPGVKASPAVMQAVGAIGVAEPAAMLSAHNHQLLCRKRKWKNITMAIAQVPYTLSALVRGRQIT